MLMREDHPKLPAPAPASGDDAPDMSGAGSDLYEAVLLWLEAHRRLDRQAITGALSQRAPGEAAPLTLNRLGHITDRDLQDAFSVVARLATSDLAAIVAPERRIEAAFMKARRGLAFRDAEGRLHLALVDPFDAAAAAGVVFACGETPIVSVIAASDQRRLHAEMVEPPASTWPQASADTTPDKQTSIQEFGRDSPVARQVADWITVAIDRRASDIHIEPRAHALTVRYRIDGALQTIADAPLALHGAVLARIKVLAELDLGERRIAQDGRTTVVASGRPVDLRVSLVPSVQGESAVIRILDRNDVRLDFEALGFSPATVRLLHRAVSWPNGLFLVTGPTGSGKTTTLYACLAAMSRTSRKILTIEDPVEYYFDHVTQVQTAPRAGVTFASAVRAFLRQDPDVILVGEIRDTETARAAVQAALTGHLVLATLHAIDAGRAAARMTDMGVEPFQLAACLRGVLSQRLVRRLCPACRRQSRPRPSEIAALGAISPDMTVFESVGCPACGHTGFTGRIAISETLEDEATIMGHARTSNDGSPRLQSTRQSTAPSSLRDDGLAKAQTGETSLSEVIQALTG